jgi:cytidine deaminase
MINKTELVNQAVNGMNRAYTPYSKFNVVILGKINIIKNNLMIFSIIKDNIWGNIFSFPKK